MPQWLITRIRRILRLPVPHHYILTDAATNVLLVVSKNAEALLVLHRMMPDTNYIPRANVPHYRFTNFLIDLPPPEYPNWTWFRKSKHFLQTHPDILTDDLKHRSQIAVEKAKALEVVVKKIGSIHAEGKHALIRENIELRKYLDALRFRMDNRDEMRPAAHPFVSQHAALMNITPHAAAAELILAGEEHERVVADTELLRLTYFEKIRKASTLEDIETIRKDFVRELRGSSLA